MKATTPTTAIIAVAVLCLSSLAPPSSRYATAWSPSIASSVRPRYAPSKSRILLQSSSTAPFENYSSAYDKNLPAALVGEAVRSALRSDRGICLDFSSDRYSTAAGAGADTADTSRLVSVVQVQGKGTHSFLNAKFSQSVPRRNNQNHDANNDNKDGTKKMQLVRKGHVYETGYLTSKGRIIDRLTVVAFPGSENDSNGDVEEAFLVTSPGNSGSSLYNELSPLVFPMDKVTLTDCSTNADDAIQTTVITLACSSLKDAQTSFNNNVLKILAGDELKSQSFEFPSRGECNHFRVSKGSGGEQADLFLMEHTFLPNEACRGYTLLVQESSATAATTTLTSQIWDNLTDEYNDKGPVGVGSLEYETLRIESGLPGYGFEMVGDGPKKKLLSIEEIKKRRSKAKEGLEEADSPSKESSQDDKNDNKSDQYYSKASPLELHMQTLVDTEKGCYQGQEGVASLLKNKRGFPRLLYQVMFFDAENDFDDTNDGGYGIANMAGAENKEWQQLLKKKNVDGALSNDTRQPQPGDELYVLGSNESIQVGTITSVAEPNGTGETSTVALALIRRSDTILKAIREMGLDLPRWWEEVKPDDDDEDDDGVYDVSSEGSSGMMRPPPLDPLHNLEVVIGGTYTVGRLCSVPSRRFGYASKPGMTADQVSGMLDYERRGEVVEPKEASATFQYQFEDDKDAQQTEPTSGESPAAPIDTLVGEEGDDMDDDLAEELLAKAEEEAEKAKKEAEAAAAEAKRKAEKMEMLKARAEAAMAARRKKKEANS